MKKQWIVKFSDGTEEVIEADLLEVTPSGAVGLVKLSSVQAPQGKPIGEPVGIIGHNFKSILPHTTLN